MEMAFADSADVMSCVEDLVKHLWSGLMQTDLPSGAFPVLSYHDAMALYGSDKPDTRLGMEVCNSL